MKTATLPALRVSPELRLAAEQALRPDETLSGLMETSLRTFVANRAADDEFIARGLRSAETARRTGIYFTADEVIARLDAKLTAARADQQKATASGQN